MKICVIDARNDAKINNSLLTLLLGDKMVVEYPIQAAITSNVFTYIYVLTDSKYIAKKLDTVNGIKIITSLSELPLYECMWVISGRAPFISESTIHRIAAFSDGKNGYSVVEKPRVDFDYTINTSFLSHESGGGICQCPCNLCKRI